MILTWLYAEGLRDSHGIIDKFIGDEMMIVFSEEFGSVDPYEDALKCATAMSEYDPWVFRPHTGVAYGRVFVGEVGTPKYRSCSVFGDTVNKASRLAGYKDESDDRKPNIVFASDSWGERDVKQLFGQFGDWQVESGVAGSDNTKGMPEANVSLLYNQVMTLLTDRDGEQATVECVVADTLKDLVASGLANEKLL